MDFVVTLMKCLYQMRFQLVSQSSLMARLWPTIIHNLSAIANVVALYPSLPSCNALTIPTSPFCNLTLSQAPALPTTLPIPGTQRIPHIPHHPHSLMLTHMALSFLIQTPVTAMKAILRTTNLLPPNSNRLHSCSRARLMFDISPGESIV